MTNGDVTPRSFIPQFFFPLMTMFAAGIVAYYTSEISTASTLARLDGSVAALSNRIAVIERWQERTEGNRFTSNDGAALNRYVESSIASVRSAMDAHERIPAHSDVLPRLARLEAVIADLKDDIEKLTAAHGPISPKP